MTVIILDSSTYPELPKKDEDHVDPDGPMPILITDGCTDSLMGSPWSDNPWRNQGDDTAWMAYFDKHGLGHHEVEAGYEYPLSVAELNWVMEDGDGFTRYGFWSYATISLYKGRKWLAPYVEYDLEYDPATREYFKDAAAKIANAVHVEQVAASHVAAVLDALNSLPFDTMIELPHGDTVFPFGNDLDRDYQGYRMFLDMDAAMKHFGDFDRYRTWMRTQLDTFVITEHPY